MNRNRFEENIGLAEKAIEKFALLELPDEKQRCREIIEVCQTRIEIRDIMETADAQLSAKEYREVIVRHLDDDMPGTDVGCASARHMLCYKR